MKPPKTVDEKRKPVNCYLFRLKPPVRPNPSAKASSPVEFICRLKPPVRQKSLGIMEKPGRRTRGFSRWSVETLSGVAKPRLPLENFSGLTATTVRPEFHATIFITNLESVFTEAATTRLEKKTSKNLPPPPVNQAVSFKAIKNSVRA